MRVCFFDVTLEKSKFHAILVFGQMQKIPALFAMRVYGVLKKLLGYCIEAICVVHPIRIGKPRVLQTFSNPHIILKPIAGTV